MEFTLNDTSNRQFYKLNVMDGQSNHLAGLAIPLLVAFIFYYYYTRLTRSSGIYHLPGIPILTASTFFNKRADFLWSHFKRHDFFQFRVLHHKVVAISGEEARKVFFGDQHLNFSEGYKILMGVGPSLENIQKNHEADPKFNKNLNKLMHKDRLNNVLPTLFIDVNKRIESWGKEGKIDPFVDVYNLVFQMTARLGTCRAISENMTVVDKMSEQFMTNQTSSTAATVLLPWFPSRNRKRIKQTSADLYVMLHDCVEAQRKVAPTSDAIDVLISEGLNTNDIVQTILGIMYAGVLNTGIISCWILIELALNADWKQKVYNEALNLVNSHLGANASGAPLHERLGSIPVSAWEDDLPNLELCLRETLRIYMNGSALRRNVHEDLIIGDKVIEKGAFVVYSLADVHLNSNIYSDPAKFDPERFTIRAEDVDSGKTYAFLGWGAGRHPCTGMKVAKLEMKLLVVLFLLTFEYKLVDENGKFPNPLPRPDRNDVHQTRPVGKPCYLQYERVTA